MSRPLLLHGQVTSCLTSILALLRSCRKLGKSHTGLSSQNLQMFILFSTYRSSNRRHDLIVQSALHFLISQLSSFLSRLCNGERFREVVVRLIKCWFVGRTRMLHWILGKMKKLCARNFHRQPLEVKRSLKNGGMSVFSRRKMTGVVLIKQLPSWAVVGAGPMGDIRPILGPLSNRMCRLYKEEAEACKSTRKILLSNSY